MNASVATPTSAAAATQRLPGLLFRFFAKYPPRLYGTYFTQETIPTLAEKIAVQGNKKSNSPPTLTASSPVTKTNSLRQRRNAQQTRTSDNPEAQAPPPLIDPETKKPIFAPEDLPPNPFLPYKNPATGHWRGPTISLRRQADLFKLARQFDVEPLLPASRKSSEWKQARILDRGLRVKGTGEGQKVKGHKWERELPALLESRIAAMERMPELVREWRMRGNGRNWRRFPSRGKMGVSLAKV